MLGKLLGKLVDLPRWITRALVGLAKLLEYGLLLAELSANMFEGEETVVKMSSWTLSGGVSLDQAVVGTNEHGGPTNYREDGEPKRSAW